MCLTAKFQAIDSTESSENEVLEDVSLDIIPQENLELNVTEMQPKNCSEKVHSYIGDVVEEKVNEVCTEVFLTKTFNFNTFFKQTTDELESHFNARLDRIENQIVQKDRKIEV